MWASVIVPGSTETDKIWREFAEKFNQIKPTLTDNEKQTVTEKFHALGIKEPEKIIAEKPIKETITLTELKLGLDVELVKLQISELTNKRKESWQFYWAGVGSTVVTGVILISVTVLVSPTPKVDPITKIEFPKVLIVHDTIYLKEKASLSDSITVQRP